MATRILIGLCVMCVASLCACSPASTPDVAATVFAALEATKAARPTETATPVPPSPTPYPTHTLLPTHTPFPTPTPVPTSTPTPEPSATPTEAPTDTPAPASSKDSGGAPAPTGGGTLLAKMWEVRGWLELYGGRMDSARPYEEIDCREIVRLSDSILSTGEFNPSDPVLAWARDRLYEAIGVFAEGSRDFTLGCRGHISGDGEKVYEAWQATYSARAGVVDALKILIGAIDKLTEEGY